MKARVKATGEIVEVGIDYNQDADFLTPNGQLYWKEELDFTNLNIREKTIMEAINDLDNIRCMVEDIHERISDDPDYWTRLEHQYAGMAMQGILTNPIGFENIRARGTNTQIETVLLASEFAHALVEKMKEVK